MTKRERQYHDFQRMLKALTRVRHGSWYTKDDGRQVRLTGAQYFYLNFSKIDGKPPEFRDVLNNNYENTDYHLTTNLSGS